MRMIAVCVMSLLLGIMLFFPMEALSERYEEENHEVKGREPYFVYLGDLKGGYRIHAEFNVTGYWNGMPEDEFFMDIIRNGSSQFFQKGTNGNTTFLVREPGNYSVRFSTSDHGADYKKIDYIVETLPPVQGSNETVDVRLFTESERPNAGTDCKLVIEFYNPNQWPVRIDVMNIDISILDEPIELEDMGLEIMPGHKKRINTSAEIPLDIETGISTYNAEIGFGLEMYESWYEGKTFETGTRDGPCFGPPDQDQDGVPDNKDDYPDDPTCSTDSDKDGVSNVEDEFPFDPNETKDSDGDGIGDNRDVFPEDSFEQYDTDDDGTGDNADAFPTDPAASKDSDGDGYPDEWNSGRSGEESTNGLEIDEFPEDASKWKSNESPMMSLLFIPMVALFIGLVFFRKRGWNA